MNKKHKNKKSDDNTELKKELLNTIGMVSTAVVVYVKKLVNSNDVSALNKFFGKSINKDPQNIRRFINRKEFNISEKRFLRKFMETQK